MSQKAGWETRACDGSAQWTLGVAASASGARGKLLLVTGGCGVARRRGTASNARAARPEAGLPASLPAHPLLDKLARTRTHRSTSLRFT